MAKEKFLVVIAGPTAVGKTDLCVRLAKELGTEIISADSRQFFRELSVGTAKPSPDELQEVTHHFIDSHSIQEAYSAGDFERDALKLIEKLHRDHEIVIATGGSGLYIKSLCEGLDDLPQPLEGLREQLTQRLHRDGLESLQAEVRELDPAFAATPEIRNPQRVVRALEVYHTVGKPISFFQNRKKSDRPFQIVSIALNRDREELYQRINDRMDVMLERGLEEEARSVIGYRSHHALQTVGYKEVYDYFDGRYDRDEMIRLLKQNTRRYAKRQITWFKHQGSFEWFQADDFDGVKRYIQSKMPAD